MRQVINGKIYDTETARHVVDISPRGLTRTDFRYEDTSLYRSPKGQYFLAGEGGALTRWSQRVGQNGRCGGSGLELVAEDEARRLVELHGTADDFETWFGAAEEG